MGEEVKIEEEKKFVSKEMLERWKAKGLVITEELAEVAIEELFIVIEEMIKKSPTLIDNILIPALPYIKKQVLELAEKIDGK
jgi:hypothetical protein